MARKMLVPPGPKRGGRGKAVFPPIPVGTKSKGKGKALVPPPAAVRAGAPPRQRVTAGMPPPSQVPVQRGPAPRDYDALADARPMGKATAAAVAASPKKRQAANALRAGRMAF
jgi:hypothetical protein